MRTASFASLALLCVACSSESGATTDAGVDGASPPPADGAVDVLAPPGDAAPCKDTCPAPAGGISFGCESRFMYGVNYAWREFAADFGGVSAWNVKSVSAAPAGYATDLGAMATNGANVIRWWLFPDFRGDGITFDAQDVPTGLGASTLADVAKALELADQAGVFLMPTWFSFDNFNATKTNNGVLIRSLTPIAKDAAKRAALISKVLRPIAKAVAASPYARRVLAWEVINEPEWAMSGPGLYGGDPAFETTAGLVPLTHTEMETFVKDVAAGLRAESSTYVTVGGAAPKWAHAWSKSGLDFYQWHYYDWVDAYWPYADGPGKYGLDKPVVVGEFPMDKLGAAPYATVVAKWYQNGYAGALSWDYATSSKNLGNVKAFAATHACETHFDLTAKSVVGTAGTAPASAPRSARLCGPGPDGRPVCR